METCKVVKLKLLNKPLKVNVNIFEFTRADTAAPPPGGLLAVIIHMPRFQLRAGRVWIRARVTSSDMG